MLLSTARVSPRQTPKQASTKPVQDLGGEDKEGTISTGSERAPPSEVKVSSHHNPQRGEKVPLTRKGRVDMGLSARPEELAHPHLPFKRQRKWTKHLWPLEALVLTQVTSASQRKGTVTASPRGSGGTMCVEQRK